MTVKFSDVVVAAQFTAELVRQGVMFAAVENDGEIVVTLTGGF